MESGVRLHESDECPGPAVAGVHGSEAYRPLRAAAHPAGSREPASLAKAVAKDYAVSKASPRKRPLRRATKLADSSEKSMGEELATHTVPELIGLGAGDAHLDHRVVCDHFGQDSHPVFVSACHY